MKLVIAMGDGFELWTAPPWFSARLRHDLRTPEVEHPDGESGTGQAVRNAEVAICGSLPPEQFKSAHKLRWIYSPAAGGHQLLFQQLVESDITLTKWRDVHGPVVAGRVVALILALAKKFPQAPRLQQKHIWGKQLLWNLNPRPAEIAGAILGLIGLGDIGGKVARHSATLGMSVIATRKHTDKDRPPDQVFPSQGLEKLLHQSDFVVLTVPVTDDTEGLSNAERLAKMKSTAYLIHVGGGQLIDETALFHALHNQKIGGEPLDVLLDEPPPPESPLWDPENLFITPHTAGLTEEMWERHYKLSPETSTRYMSGQELPAGADKKRAY